jgi:RNA polymerase sigma-70 factor (ECF subfamily)
VLGYSARETAATLETSTQSVNSALQRARKTVEDRLPERSQQATLRALGDKRLSQIVQSYMDAMQRGDVGQVVSMLTADAAWSMPPLASWFAPRDQVAEFLGRYPLSGEFRWRHVPTQCNGQPAIGCYTWDDDKGAYIPFCIDVLTFEGDKIKDVTAFIVRSIDDRTEFADFPDRPGDLSRADDVFGQFALPLSLA